MKHEQISQVIEFLNLNNKCKEPLRSIKDHMPEIVMNENRTLFYPLEPVEVKSGIILPNKAQKSQKKFNIHPYFGVVIKSNVYPEGSIVFFMNNYNPELVIVNETAFQSVHNGNILLCLPDGLEFLIKNKNEIVWE